MKIPEKGKMKIKQNIWFFLYLINLKDNFIESNSKHVLDDYGIWIKWNELQEYAKDWEGRIGSTVLWGTYTTQCYLKIDILRILLQTLEQPLKN